MYRDLQSIAAFVAVAETGAFTKAAKRLGVSPSVISHHIAKLESSLDETLIYRTTRKMTLSEKGRKLFDAALTGLNGIQDVLDSIQDQHDAVVGALRITLPAFVPDPVIEERIMAFASRYPDVALDLDYTDQLRDLVEDGYDLSIRLGDLPNSTFMRRKLSEIHHVLVASPDFIARNELILSPSDLAQVPYVAMGDESCDLCLYRKSEENHVSLQYCQIQVKNIYAAKAATVAGLGIGNLPMPLLSHEIASGKLVQVLPGWELPKLMMQAIWPETTKRTNLTKRIVDFLAG